MSKPSQKEKEDMVAAAAKSGVPSLLDLLDKARADEGIVALCLSRLLSSPFDQVCAFV